MKLYGIFKNSESILRQGVEEIVYLWAIRYLGVLDEDKLLSVYPEDGGGKLLRNGVNYHCPQYRCEGGSPYKFPEARLPEWGPFSEYVAHVCVFLGSAITCLLHKLTRSGRAQVTLQLRFSLSDLV